MVKTKICKIEGCNEKHEALGYCKRHYRMFKKYGDPLAKPIRKKKPVKPYEEAHKIINGVEYKLCNICNEWLPMTEEYFYKNKNNGIDGFYPYCKKDAIEKADKRLESIDPEIRKGYFKKCDSKESRKKLKGEYSKKQKENGYYKKWQHENPDKISGYNRDRKMNKEHDITDEEWYACLDYFDNRCAYCGLSEQEQFSLYGEQFHKEHVIHNGSNYIDNCVPSCTSCNTSKNVKEFNDWYNKNNKSFSKRRLNKIIKWMTEECFNALNLQ